MLSESSARKARGVDTVQTDVQLSGMHHFPSEIDLRNHHT